MDPRLISVDELRAAGALDVPAKWRKSLAIETTRERDLFSDLIDEEQQPCEDQPQVSVPVRQTHERLPT